jgi:hypothetical protein
MRTAIGATAVNIAKPTNLGVPMIHAFLDNIRYITIELNGLTLYDTRDDVPCDMDKWRETRARFPARWPVVRLKRPTSETPGRRSEPHPFAKVGLSQKFVSEITFSNLRFLYLCHAADVNGHTVGQRIGYTASRPSPRPLINRTTHSPRPA